jgi:hypothetical protein
MIARDFFTVDTVAMRWIYLLFFIEISSRRVDIAGMTRVQEIRKPSSGAASATPSCRLFSMLDGQDMA